LRCGGGNANIPPDILPTFFEHFIITKGETESGLGLWVISEIMKKNGWTFRVRSSKNPLQSGMVFSIVIPKIDLN